MYPEDDFLQPDNSRCLTSVDKVIDDCYVGRALSAFLITKEYYFYGIGETVVSTMLR